MKKKVLIISLIFVFIVAVFSITYIVLNDNKNLDNSKEVVEDESDSNAFEELEEEQIKEEIIKELPKEDPVKSDNNTSINSSNNQSSTTTNKGNNSTANQNTSDNSSNTSSDNNNVPPAISQVPIWSWLINDFPISVYGSEQASFNACDKKGEQYMENYVYSCTTVVNVDGILIGYMLGLKEKNTGNSFDWR